MNLESFVWFVSLQQKMNTILKFHNAILFFCSILHQTATFHALLISAKPSGKSRSVTIEQCSGMRTMTKMRQQLYLLVRNFWKQNFWYLEITFLVLKLLVCMLVSLRSWLSAFSVFACSVCSKDWNTHWIFLLFSIRLIF